MKNITNFLMIILVIFGMFYTQIFRALLFVKMSTIDTKWINRNRFVVQYPLMARAVLIGLFLFLLPYFNSLGDLFFTRLPTIPPEYTWDNCDDYWTCVGGVLDTKIRYHTTGIEQYINFIIFLVVIIVTANFIFMIPFSLLIKDLQAYGIGGRSGEKSASVAEICLI